MTDSAHSETVELYVRSLTASERQVRLDETLDRLARLEAAGELDDVTVHVWGEGVCLSGPAAETPVGRDIRGTVDEFREWAASSDVDLVGFERREARSMLTDECHENLRLPALALAHRTDGDLAFVAPCADGDGCRSVGDHLDSLEGAGEDPEHSSTTAKVSIRAD
ncbi:HTH domain-containing protein [Halomarina ordinaria]|uniref:HTH domain-containing protein n=1 Tax=Halomarina ordinaria TaxID=3033939 RepID=A0ABD5U341_9EURY|nr:HTH domain-containing protein [Halomarina sp. PSRA2]